MTSVLLTLLLAIALPAAPRQYVTDNAGVLTADRAAMLEQRLRDFDKQTTNQVIVYIDRHVPPGATMEEMATAALRQWGVGQKDKPRLRNADYPGAVTLAVDTILKTIAPPVAHAVAPEPATTAAPPPTSSNGPWTVVVLILVGLIVLAAGACIYVIVREMIRSFRQWKEPRPGSGSTDVPPPFYESWSSGTSSSSATSHGAGASDSW